MRGQRGVPNSHKPRLAAPVFYAYRIQHTDCYIISRSPPHQSLLFAPTFGEWLTELSSCTHGNHKLHSHSWCAQGSLGRWVNPPACRCRCCHSRHCSSGRPDPPHVVSLGAVGVGAVAMLMSKDIKQSSAMLRRNMRHIRTWLEEQGAAAE